MTVSERSISSGSSSDQSDHEGTTSYLLRTRSARRHSNQGSNDDADDDSPAQPSGKKRMRREFSDEEINALHDAVRQGINHLAKVSFLF